MTIAQPATTQPKRLAYVGLCLALVAPWLIDGLFGAPLRNDPAQITWALIRSWGVTIALLLWVVYAERLPLSSIGVRRMTGRDVAWGVGGFVVGVLSFGLTMPLVNALGLGNTNGGIAQLAQIPLLLRLAIVLTAGISEEILFRGYPIERLAALTGNRNLGAAMAYLVFVALHIPLWGLGGTIQIGVWSLVVTFVYLRRRNLLACMLMHVLNDGFAFIVVPWLMGLAR